MIGPHPHPASRTIPAYVLRELKLRVVYRVCSEWAALPHVPWDRCPLARDLSEIVCVCVCLFRVLLFE